MEQASRLTPDKRLLPDPAVPFRRAAVLLLLYPRAGEEYIVFTRRTDTVEHHKGQISLPGGAQDPGDPDLAYTALRETQEEIGLDPARVEIIGTMEEMYAHVSNFMITPIIGRLRTQHGSVPIAGDEPLFKPNPGEVAEIIEVPMRALRDETIHRIEERTWEGVNYTIHYYTYGPHEIWGVTGHIINRFLAEKGGGGAGVLP